jgi:hypothetical protein
MRVIALTNPPSNRRKCGCNSRLATYRGIAKFGKATIYPDSINLPIRDDRMRVIGCSHSQVQILLPLIWDCSSVVRASACLAESRGFKSRQSRPTLKFKSWYIWNCSSVVEHLKHPSSPFAPWGRRTRIIAS